MRFLHLENLHTPSGFWRRCAAVLAVSLALVACSGEQPSPANAPQAAPNKATPKTRPHVVIISLDTTRADNLGAYGHPWVHTPNIDALANDALVFTDCQTAVTTTLASHTSLFTGKYAHTHGVPMNGHKLDPDNVTLAEALKEDGYKTAGFIGAFPLASKFQFSQGFDVYNEEVRAMHGAHRKTQRSAKDVTDAALDYLKTFDKNDKLFLFMHFFDAHTPYIHPKRFINQYEDVPDATGKPFKSVKNDLRRIIGKRNPGALPRLEQLYAAGITYTDEQIGRIIETLKDMGIYDNSLVLLTSDHGESLWDKKPYFDHGFTVYQYDCRAIGILRLPQSHYAGNRCDNFISSIDLMPTILDYLDLPVPSGVEGVPIPLEKAARNELAPRVRYCEASRPHGAYERNTKWLNERKANGIRAGDYKFIETLQTKKQELYNLRDDPGETHNLLDSPTPEITERAEVMRELLQKWRKKTGTAKTQKDESKETVERLKSLGYL